MTEAEAPERSVRFFHAYHRCDPDPAKDLGISGVRIAFVLRQGDRGVEWFVHTGMGLPRDAFERACPDCTHPSHRRGHPTSSPTSGPVVWHEPRQIFEFSSASADDCSITGGRCWTDAGYLLGDGAYRALTVEGEEGLWAFLERMLEREDAPDV